MNVICIHYHALGCSFNFHSCLIPTLSWNQYKFTEHGPISGIDQVRPMALKFTLLKLTKLEPILPIVDCTAKSVTPQAPKALPVSPRNLEIRIVRNSVMFPFKIKLLPGI